MNIRSIPPDYGVNYDRGYVGFTYHSNILSGGIAYFEHWDRLSDISVTHSFLVTGKNSVIEAHIDTGVACSTLSKYFNDESCRVFFRKPLGLTYDIATQLILAAQSKVGLRYGTSLLIAEAINNTVVGHYLDQYTKGYFSKWVTKMFDNPNEMICSELVAYCLQKQPQYMSQGVLANPVDLISPQRLFEDTVIFEPWKKELIHA